jgi:hypothetical protein
MFFTTLISIAINRLFPVTLEKSLKHARRLRTVSRERKDMTALENKVRALQARKMAPVTPADWWWYDMTRTQALFHLRRKYEAVQMFEDVTRLEDELSFLKSNRKARASAPDHPTTDKDGWTHIDASSAKYGAVNVELSDSELRALQDAELFDLDKAKVIKAEMMQGKPNRQIARDLTKRYGKRSGYGKTSVTPYITALNSVIEANTDPSPTVVEWG